MASPPERTNPAAGALLMSGHTFPEIAWIVCPRCKPLWLLMLLAFGSTACGTVQSTFKSTGRSVERLVPGAKPPPDLDAVTLRLMRFADLSAYRLTTATQEFAARAGTPEARIQALVWQIDYSRAFWRAAAGPQPYEGLLSSIVVATMCRRAHEERYLPIWGESDRVVIDSLLRIEQDAWALAAASISEEQLEQARALITSWVESGDHSEASALPSFAELLASRPEGAGTGGLRSLIMFDPLSGLAPAVAEVEQSRRLAERALYYLQHLPTLLSAQVELTGMRSARSPELQGALTDWQRFSAASASIAATAEGLPASIAVEREALLDQLSREITAQREGLLRDLEAAEEPLNEILGQTQGTAEAGREMSLAVTRAFEAGLALSRSIDEMVDSSAARRERAVAAGGVPPRRFDITDYTAAAESVTRGAQALSETLASFDRSLPNLQLAVNDALSRGNRTVDHAFVRALQLLAIALVGGAAAALVVRRITMRWSAQARRAGSD